MASIMGGPPAMLQPFTAVIEPQAHQCHQAAMACRASQTQQELALLRLSDATPADEPQLTPSSSIARLKLQDLSPADFRKLYWKTDTPVIVTGMPTTQHRCIAIGEHAVTNKAR